MSTGNAVGARNAALQAPEAEINVLGAMLIDGAAIPKALAIVAESDFTSDRHRTVFAAAVALHRSGSAVDPALVADCLSARGELEQVGGLAFFGELLDAVSTAANVSHHARALAERSTRRHLLRDLQDGTVELPAAIRRAENRLQAIHAAGPSGSAVKVITGQELFAAPVTPQQMLLPPRIPRGRQGAIYSGPGEGKSMLLRIISGAIATGALDAFGRFPAERGMVLWVSTEEDLEELRRGFAITAAGSGYALEPLLENLRILPLRGTPFTLSEPQHRDALEEQIKALQPVLAVADSLASMSGHDLKDDQAILPLLRWGGRISTSYDVTWCWIAHDRKSNPQAAAYAKPNDLDDLFGSRQVSAQLDFAYRLLSAGNDRTLRCTKMRGSAKPEDLALEVTSVPDEKFGMRCVTGMSRVSRSPELVEAVRAHLANSPGDSMSGVRDTIARRLKIRPADVGEIVKDLLAQQKIQNRGTEFRFKLHWTDGACPGVSQPVPDALASDRVRVSQPPLGGRTRDMGHAEAEQYEEEWFEMQGREA